MNAKTKIIIAWVLTVLAAIMLISSGVMKLMGNEEVIKLFTKWGYPNRFLLFVGAAEVAGAIALFIPRLRTMSIICLALLMLGAIYTHIAHEETTQIGGAIGVLVFLTAIYFLRRPSVVN